MNKLICECKHLRKEHESGKELLQDSSVTKCMIKDCPCNLYHSNYETRKEVWKIRYKALFWCGMIIIGCIILGIVGTAMINNSVDITMKDYNIIPKPQILIKYQNGTLTNSTFFNSFTPNESIKDSAWLPMFIVLAFIAIIGSMSAYLTMFESEYRRLVRE